MGDEKHALDECLQFVGPREKAVLSINNAGVDFQMYGSFLKLMMHMDRYHEHTRFQVWDAVARFTHDIASSARSVG